MASNSSPRKITVTTRTSRPTGRQVPQLRISGAWLGQAGFSPGTALDVAVSQGMLVITVAVDAAPPYPVLVWRAVADLRREYRRRFPSIGSGG